MIQNPVKQAFIPFFFLVLIVASNIAGAQTQVGVRAGINFSNVIMKDENGKKAKTQSTPGIQLGLTVDIPVIADLYVQPAFLYSRKGFEQKTNGFYGSASDFKVKADYIEVPVTILFKPQLGIGHLLVGAGPYVSYGTGGNWTSGSSAAIGDIMVGDHGDVIFRNDASKGGSIESYTYGRPLDYGAGFLAGYEFRRKLSVQFNAQIGLANLVPEFSGFERKDKLKNTNFGISAGYKF